MRKGVYNPSENSGPFATHMGLTSNAPAVTNRESAETHALADTLALQLAETDDCSLEPLAAASGVRRDKSSAVTRCTDPIGEVHFCPNLGDPSTVPGKGNFLVGVSKSGSSGGVVDDRGDGDGDDDGSDSGSELYSSRRLEDYRNTEVAGLAVGPLLAARVPGDSYSGVPAEQHGVDVRQLQQLVTPVEPPIHGSWRHCH
ncbi:hypothetical protein Vafri_9858 [Volvox africanus]|uniref:Uncharacterized protein n=1 Tax=Volvox africanus TaxID=51714 RepID=A0A8J4B9H5_9CHLO|nr:hypothetical protein Vafri_9858 [Volvox africanus]